MALEIRRERLLPWLLVLLMAAAVLAFLDKWLYSNELFHSLSMGLSYSASDKGLLQLRAEAIQYCKSFAPDAQLKECEVYQNVITERLFFSHPISALFGREAASLIHDHDWLRKLHRIAILPPIVGGIIAISLWSLLTFALPKQSRSYACILFFIYMATSQSFDYGWTLAPDLTRDGGSWVPLLTALGFVAVGAAVAHDPRPVEHVVGRLERWAGEISGKRLLIAAAGLYAVSLALPSAFNAPIAILAFLLLLALLPGLSRATRWPPLMCGAVLGLLFAAATADFPWFMRRFGYASSYASLVYVAVIGLVTLRRDSPLVWLMPTIALFHLPIAALTGLATACAELVISIFARLPSPLLVPALLTFAIGLGGSLLGIQSAAFAPGSADPSAVLALLWTWPGLLPAALSCVLMLSLALLPLASSTAMRVELSRSGLLIAQAVAAGLISQAILSEDASLLNAPGYGMFAKPADYASPALFAAGLYAIFLCLHRETSLNGSGSAEGLKVRYAIPIVLALSLISGKLDLKFRMIYAATVPGLWNYVLKGKVSEAWCGFLGEASLDDDVYYLSTRDPTNDAVIYWSALKARLRIQEGLFNERNFAVRPAVRRDAGCATEPAGPRSGTSDAG
jgi:hypothetical protein